VSSAPQKRKAFEIDEVDVDNASSGPNSGDMLNPAQHLDDSDSGDKVDSEVEEDDMDSFLDVAGIEPRMGDDI